MSCQIMINNNNNNNNNSNNDNNNKKQFQLNEEEEELKQQKEREQEELHQELQEGNDNTILTNSIRNEKSLKYIVNSLFYKDSTKNKNNQNNRIKIGNKVYDDQLLVPVKNLMDLPDDLLLRIFKYMDVSSLVKISSLCNFFHSVASNHDLWKEHFFKKWGPLYPLVPVCTISCCHQYFSNPYCYLEPINQLFSQPFYKSLSIPQSILSALPTSLVTFKQLYKFRSLLFSHYKPIVMDGLKLLQNTCSIADIWMKINDPILSSSINSVTQSRVEKAIIQKQPTTYINSGDQTVSHQVQTTFCVKVIKIFPTRILKQLLNLITDYEKIPLWDVSLRHCTGLIVKSPNYNNSKSVASNNSELDPIKKVDILHKQIIGNLYMTYVRMIFSQHDDNLKFFNDTLSGLNNIEDINNIIQPTNNNNSSTTTTTNNCNNNNNQNNNLKRKRSIDNETEELHHNHNHNNNKEAQKQEELDSPSLQGNNKEDGLSMNKQKALKISREFKKKAEENESFIRQQIINDVNKSSTPLPLPCTLLKSASGSNGIPSSSTISAATASLMSHLVEASNSPKINSNNSNGSNGSNGGSTSSSSSSSSLSSSASSIIVDHVAPAEVLLKHPIYIVQNAVPFKIAGDEYTNKYETFKLDCFGSGFIFEPLNENGKETKMTYLLQMGKQDWMEDVGELIDEMAISRNRSLNSLISHSYQLSKR